MVAMNLLLPTWEGQFLGIPAFAGMTTFTKVS